MGEESGDALGAELIDAIRRERPEARLLGLAGERMQARGMASLFPVADVTAMGFLAVLRHLPRILRRVWRLTDAVVAARPDLLVIIDSPGFTHAVARRVARRAPEIAIVNYVSPSVWAWWPSRAARMTRYIDHVLALLPFEPEAHERLGGPPCTYVGHPLMEKLDELRPAPGERPPLGERPTLLILPGSRRSEIAHLMAPFGEAAARLAARNPRLDIVLPAVSHLVDEIGTRAALWPVKPRIVCGEAEKWRAFRSAHAALAASGTVTLELALAQVPMVVAYKVERLARLLKPLLFKAHSIVLANLAIGENVVPEFLNSATTPGRLADSLGPLLDDGPARARQMDAFVRLESLMQLPEGERPSEAAARLVLKLAASGPRPARRGKPPAPQRRFERGM